MEFNAKLGSLSFAVYWRQAPISFFCYKDDTIFKLFLYLFVNVMDTNACSSYVKIEDITMTGWLQSTCVTAVVSSWGPCRSSALCAAPGNVSPSSLSPRWTRHVSFQSETLLGETAVTHRVNSIYKTSKIYLIEQMFVPTYIL